MVMKRIVVLAASALSLQLHTEPVMAQDSNLFARDRNISVSERYRPEFQPLGSRWGGFIAYPALRIDLGYNDNITIAESEKQSAQLVYLLPSLNIRSDWSRHSLSTYARAAVTRHPNYEQDDTESWTVGANGRVDTGAWSALRGGLEIGRQVESRAASSAPQAIAEPVQYDLRSAYTSFGHIINRVRFDGQLVVRQYSFEDVRLVDGSVRSLRDRDQTTYQASGRVDYALSPASALYVRAMVNRRAFDLPGTAATPNRDSRGLDVVAGADFEVTNLVRGEIGLGYLEQVFDEAMYGRLSGLSANARVEYFATPILTLGLTANRSVNDSGVPGSAGILATVIEGTADYEARRNILINASLGYTNESFDALDRENRSWFASLRASYLVNRHLSLTANYDRASRDSRGAQSVNDFTANRFRLSFAAQY